MATLACARMLIDNFVPASATRRISMIGYVTLGTNDLPKAVAFYEKLLAPLGAKRFMENEQFVAFGAGEDQPGIGITKPYDGKPATHGNGTMVALQVDSPQKVDEMYALAMSLGGTDEGKPGARGGG